MKKDINLEFGLLIIAVFGFALIIYMYEIFKNQTKDIGDFDISEAMQDFYGY